MKLVYFGKKYPKVIKTVPPEKLARAKEEDRRKAIKGKKITGGGVSFIPLNGEEMVYSFEPFKQIEVKKEVGDFLLEHAGDLFKCIDTGDSAPDPEPKVKTDGYVGSVPAERIKDLDKLQKKQVKLEEGKSIEEVIETERDKKKNKAKEAK